MHRNSTIYEPFAGFGPQPLEYRPYQQRSATEYQLEMQRVMQQMQMMQKPLLNEDKMLLDKIHSRGHFWKMRLLEEMSLA